MSAWPGRILSANLGSAIAFRPPIAAPPAKQRRWLSVQATYPRGARWRAHGTSCSRRATRWSRLPRGAPRNGPSRGRTATSCSRLRSNLTAGRGRSRLRNQSRASQPRPPHPSQTMPPRRPASDLSRGLPGRRTGSRPCCIRPPHRPPRTPTAEEPGLAKAVEALKAEVEALKAEVSHLKMADE